MNHFVKLIFITTIYLSISFDSQAEQETSKPLLRVFPIYRTEECEWAIRMFVCQKCIARKERYAQKIHFYENGLYRVHGCYTKEKGFVPEGE